ncbi:hypothetical protein ACROYT_G042235 [Oculina patagonica]
MGLFDGNHTVNAITCSNVKQGPAGVGFKLTPSGDYDMENKKIFKLKTQADVKIDADYDSYALDLSSAVNKDYLKLNCLIKDAAGNDFDANQATINNSAPYYDGLYSENSLVSKKYVDLMDNNKADLSTKNEQTFNSIINVPNFDQGYSNMSNVMNKKYIDSRDALKADKQYSDDTYLTKNTGAILSNSIQSKASKVYVNSTFLTKSVGNSLAQSIQNRLNIHGSNMMQADLNMGSYNITNLNQPTNDTDAVNKNYMEKFINDGHKASNRKNEFKYVMENSDSNLSEENDIEIGDSVDYQNSPHSINKKCVKANLLLDKSKGFYSSRIGINLYPLSNNSYTVCIEIILEDADIDTSSIDLNATSSIETIHNQKPRIYDSEQYARLICDFTKSQNIGNNYLFEDIVIKKKAGSVYSDKLSVYFIIYGIQGRHPDVYSTVYDNLFDVSLFGNMDMKNLKIVNLGDAEYDGDAVNFKQMKEKITADLNMVVLTLQPKSYYNQVFDYFFDLLDSSNFIMSDSNGAVVSGLNATGGIALITISTISLLIQGWMIHKNLELKIQNSTYAYQSYQHLLNSIKNMMRCGVYNPSSIIISMKNIDDYVADTGPIIDKYLRKYDKKFIG